MSTAQLFTKMMIKRIRKRQLNLCVIGLGRIGLPTAALFAKGGISVIGVDIDPRVVRDVNLGSCRFIDEPNLEEILRKVVASKSLMATTDINIASEKADVIIVCVPTPVNESKTPDYSYITSVSRDISQVLRKGVLIIIESTVGPGVIEGVVRQILEKGSGLIAGPDFGLASCPERADPGFIIGNMTKVPRIVGGIDKMSTDAAATLYQQILGVKVVKVSSPKVANAVKLTENLFRDVNIALANEFALLYEKLGIDTFEVIKACSTKYNFMPHYPGPGVGGPCLPSNPYYLIVEATKVGNIPYLVRLAREINDRMPSHVVSLISEALNDIGKTVKNSRIAILGVAYKPNVKDVQLSPIEIVYRRLVEMGAHVFIFDSYFKGEEVFGTKVEKSIDAAIKDADCIVVGTDHREFSQLDLNSMHKIANNRVALVDTRRLIKPELAESFGFVYRSIGRPRS